MLLLFERSEAEETCLDGEDVRAFEVLFFRSIQFIPDNYSSRALLVFFQLERAVFEREVVADHRVDYRENTTLYNVVLSSARIDETVQSKQRKADRRVISFGFLHSFLIEGNYFLECPWRSIKYSIFMPSSLV